MGMYRQGAFSVMVWGGICSTGRIHFIFISEGLKVNQDVYRNDISEAVVLS